MLPLMALMLHFLHWTEAQVLSDQPLLTDADFDILLGDTGLPPNYAALAAPPVSYEPILGAPPLPTRFSWKDKGITQSVKSQIRCAACWAFANAAVMESVIMKDFGVKYDISEQQLISCVDWLQGCKGGSMSSFDFFQQNQPQLETCNPYTGTDQSTVSCPKCAPTSLPYRAVRYETISPSDVDGVKRLLMQKGPAYFPFVVYRPFYDYWRGLAGKAYVHPPDAEFKGGHAVQLLGWDDNLKAWHLQNSWGMRPPGPNNDGTFYLRYEDSGPLNYGVAFVTVEKTEGPTPSTPSTTSTTTTTTITPTKSTTTTTTTKPDTGGLGKSPIQCSSHTDCYVVREPKYMYEESRKGGIRYLTGCNCADNVCKISAELSGRQQSADCIYCGTECGNTNAFFAKL